MSAEILRNAADQIREAVEVAARQPATDAVVRGVWLNGRYHVAFSVPAALAVAEWLDMCAEAYLAGQVGNYPFTQQALAVARTYLGEPA